MNLGNVRLVRLVASRLILSVCLIVISLLVLARAVDRGFNHDEHQFVAPAILFQRDGLLPYRDFAFLHMPNTVLIYGAVSTLSEYKILSMRLVSGAAAAIFVSLFFLYVWRHSQAVSLRTRLVTAVALTTILLASPLFLAASGLTWNHDLPVLFTFVAFILTGRAVQGHSRRLSFFISGLCIALAAGTRLTFAPLFAPFFLVPFLIPGVQLRDRIGMAVWFSFGSVIGMLPSLYFFAIAPDAFLFGNFESPRLPLLDPENTRIQKTIKPTSKARFFIKEIVLSNWPVFVAFFGVAIPGIWQKWRERTPDIMHGLVNLLILPFLLFGCFAPSRYQYQHFYAAIPFLLLTSVQAMRERHWRPRVALVVLMLASLAFGIFADAAEKQSAVTAYADSLKTLTQPEKWTPIKIHKKALSMRAYVPEGKILTLSPGFVVEAGLDIYPELAVGPFLWRNANLLSPEQRKQYRAWGSNDLGTVLADDPPAGVLVGYEGERVDAPLRIYAQQAGQHPVKLKDDKDGELYVK